MLRRGDSIFRSLTHLLRLSRPRPSWSDFRLAHSRRLSSRSKRSDFSFLTTEVWNPVTEQFGALAPIYGTIITSAIAMLVAVPISIGIAVFLTELCPMPLRRPIGIAIELLAGVPSIIYGIWGLFFFAPFMQQYVQPDADRDFQTDPCVQSAVRRPAVRHRHPDIGSHSRDDGLPFITAVCRDVFETVPPVLKEAAYGMGWTTREVVGNVVIPYTRVGIIGGVMLGPRPRPRRDHGRHVRDRQRPPDFSVDHGSRNDNLGDHR